MTRYPYGNRWISMPCLAVSVGLGLYALVARGARSWPLLALVVALLIVGIFTADLSGPDDPD